MCSIYPMLPSSSSNACCIEVNRKQMMKATHFLWQCWWESAILWYGGQYHIFPREPCKDEFNRELYVNCLSSICINIPEKEISSLVHRQFLLILSLSTVLFIQDHTFLCITSSYIHKANLFNSVPKHLPTSSSPAAQSEKVFFSLVSAVFPSA